jgi:ligand-binding sensor domain-containing protein
MKHIAIILCFLWMVFIPLISTAQSSSFVLQYEGATPKINQLYQLSSGYIVLGTSHGLFKFDGIGFSRYQHVGSAAANVSAICELSNGIVWLGFEDGKLGLLQHNTVVMQTPQEGFPKVAIRKIIQDKNGIVWIATAGEGIYYFTNNRFYNINTDDGLSDDYVYDVAEIDYAIVAGTDRGINTIIFKNGKKDIDQFTSAQGLEDNIVTCIVPSGDKKFWFGMQAAGLGQFSVSNYYQSSTANIDWKNKQANAILATANNIYIGTEQHGIISFDVNGKQDFPTSFTSIPFNGKVSALLQDKQGNLWAAGNNQLARFGTTLVTKLFSIPPTANLHAVMVDAEGHIWYNDKQMLQHASKHLNETWTFKSYKLPLNGKTDITALYEDKFGHVWIGTMGNGLLVLDPNTKRFRKITEDALLLNGSILSISGKNNSIWIASLEGAIKCELVDANNNINSTYHFTDFTAISGIGSNYIYDIYTDKQNRVWFATDGKGITVWDGKSFINYNQNNGLPDEVIYQITEDRSGNIWCSTFKGGLVKFDGKRFTAYTSKHGLSNATIAALVVDQNDNLMITHQAGIDVLNTLTGSFSYLNQQQGIGAVNTDLNTLTSNSDGGIYFVADNALMRFKTNRLLPKPTIVIDKIQLFLVDTVLQQHHAFAYDANNISFFFTGIDYSHPQQLQYQYQLEGYSNVWMTTKDRSVNFPKLPPGKYTFKVRTSINSNFDQASEATFSFSIKKAIWQRWWFVTIAILLFVGLLLWWIKNREARLQQWEKIEREKIHAQFETLRNQVNPHFLFNSFNTLIAEIEDHPEQAVEYVEHLSDFYRSIVVYREKDIIPLQEELDLMQHYFFIQQKRYGSAFSVHVDILPQVINTFQIAPLTLQLLIENAVKHNAVSIETPLQVHIHIQDAWLVVENSIQPKLKPEKSSGLGLEHIKKRYQLLTGKTVVIEQHKKYFKVSIPLITKAK